PRRAGRHPGTRDGRARRAARSHRAGRAQQQGRFHHDRARPAGSGVTGQPISDEARRDHAVFRAVLGALSYPGRVSALAVGPPIAGLSEAASAVLRALADHETPIWLAPELAHPGLAAELLLHCGCPIVPDPAASAFALVGDGIAELDLFACGDPYA